MAQEWKKGTPLDEDYQTKLRALVRQEGLEKTSKKLEVSTVSITRAAAGFNLRRVTITVIKMKMDEIAKVAA